MSPRELPLTLRDATPDDASAAAKVKVEAFRPIYEPIVHLGFEEDLDLEAQEQWLRQVLSREARPEWFFVVADAPRDGVVGWARGELAPQDEPRYDALLAGVFVYPSYQRRGLGRRLMRESAVRFRSLGATSLKLQTMSTSPSRHFYDRLGGSCVAEQEVAPGVVDVIYGWSDISALIDA